MVTIIYTIVYNNIIYVVIGETRLKLVEFVISMIIVYAIYASGFTPMTEVGMYLFNALLTVAFVIETCIELGFFKEAK